MEREKDIQGLKTALFWVITQGVAAISYGRFGTSYLSYLQGEP